jgi:CRP-like cAMP-binding protein
MLIRETDLFKGMSQVFMTELGEIMGEKSYKEGTFLFKEGDATDYFYVLEEGRVKLSIGGRGHIVTIVTDSGEAFGWSSLVGRETYTATAECLVPCRLIRIEKEKLNKLFEKHMSDGVIFYKHLAGIVGQRLINSYNSLLSAQPVENIPSYG